MFRIACGLPAKQGWGVAPSEFWNMCPAEWWALFEINVGSGIRDDQEARERIKRLYYMSKEQERQQ